MDETAKYNIARWKALADANALFTRPYLDLTPATARESMDPEARLGDLAGKDVLLLAGGGGQQSAAFALLGANVTVLDLSPAQLERDRQAATHYNLSIQTFQGDMRDLSPFHAASFDLVYHPYSLNFVPDPRPVFREVARVLRPGGLYWFNCANPFTIGLTEQDWNGQAYPLTRPYTDGAQITYADPEWVYNHTQQDAEPVPTPIEYRHTLSTLTNTLVGQGFQILHLIEQRSHNPDLNAQPGTWDHFTNIAPPFLAFWSIYHPATLEERNLL